MPDFHSHSPGPCPTGCPVLVAHLTPTDQLDLTTPLGAYVRMGRILFGFNRGE